MELEDVPEHWKNIDRNRMKERVSERANKINRVSKSDSPERVRERNGNKERQGNREMSRERSSRSRVSLEDFVLI